METSTSPAQPQQNHPRQQTLLNETLCLALQFREFEVADILLNLGADPRCFQDFPLRAALLVENEDWVDRFLALGASFETPCEKYSSFRVWYIEITREANKNCIDMLAHVLEEAKGSVSGSAPDEYKKSLARLDTILKKEPSLTVLLSTLHAAFIEGAGGKGTLMNKILRQGYGNVVALLQAQALGPSDVELSTRQRPHL